MSNSKISDSRILRLSCAAILSFGLLTACDDVSERAAKHFEAAVAYVDSGDEERARIEFLNVFKLDPDHINARTAFAELNLAQGDYREAISNFTKLTELLPEGADAYVSLAKIYAELGAWDLMAAPVEALGEIAPDNIEGRALTTVYFYRQAVIDRDAETAKKHVEDAAELLGYRPDDVFLRQIGIDDKVQRGQYDAALAALDETIAIAPNAQQLYDARLTILASLGDGLAIEQQLIDDVARLPDDPERRMTLAKFYISQNLLDQAEDVLREAVEVAPEPVQAQLTLLQFISDFRTREEALAQADELMANGAVDLRIELFRSEIAFAIGQNDAAIAHLVNLIAENENDDSVHLARVSLAKMLNAAGRDAEAQKLVLDTLAQDAGNVEAAKLRATSLIESDRTGEAIAILRAALDRADTDASIYTLLARAHARDGNTDLVGEMLSLASQAAGNSAEHSMRFGRFLLGRGNYGPAETVLIDALRRDPSNPDVLELLGRKFLATSEWARLDQVITGLEALDTPSSTAKAGVLRASKLRSQSQGDEAIRLLEQLVAQGAVGPNADWSIVRSYLANREEIRAMEYLETQMNARPDDLALVQIRAATLGALGKTDEAEAQYRDGIARDPSNPLLWLGLYRLLREDGRAQDATKVADEALVANPDNPRLLWVKASELQANGNLRGAATIYEALYAQDSDNLVIANNLANILVEISTDPATVNRATIIARRLRNSTLPPFLDTYGWLATLRGDFDAAIRALEPAAAAANEDAKVQYHLGRAYAGASRQSEALAQYRIVTDLVATDDAREFVEFARTEITRIEALADSQ